MHRPRHRIFTRHHEEGETSGRPGTRVRGKVARQRVRLLLLRTQILPRSLPRDAGHAEREPHAHGLPREHRRDGEGPRRSRGRRRRLRPLHPVRRLRAALPEHAVHRRLLPPPDPHRRRREGHAGPDGETRATSSAGWKLWNERLARGPQRAGAGRRRACPRSTSPTGRSASTSRSAARRSCSSTARPPSTAPPTRARSRSSSRRAGVEFGLMREQWCCGGPAAEMGYVDLARKHAEHNVADWRAVGAKRIIAPDPHDFIAFTEDYPKLLRRRLRVRDRARRRAGQRPRARTGGSSSRTPVERTVTYHDPCRLNKRKGVHEAPRELLRAIPGITFNDVDRVTQWSYCSGGGGGLPIEKPEITAEISQAAASPRRAELEVDTLISACPWSERPLTRRPGTTANIDVIDLFELRRASARGSSREPRRLQERGRRRTSSTSSRGDHRRRRPRPGRPSAHAPSARASPRRSRCTAGPSTCPTSRSSRRPPGGLRGRQARQPPQDPDRPPRRRHRPRRRRRPAARRHPVDVKLMNRIHEIDLVDRTVTVGPGINMLKLNEELRAARRLLSRRPRVATRAASSAAGSAPAAGRCWARATATRATS